MALVPAICTQCGATLSADKSNECMICPYCGTPFIVEKAINNFRNIYNITNSTVNIFGGKTEDFVIRAGVLEKYNGADTIVIIPSNITMIGKDSFYECSGLQEVIIPEGITEIESSAFCGCTSLQKISLPNGLKRIGGLAFYNCRSLVEVTLPDSVTEIGTQAFGQCSNLKSIKMPNSERDTSRGMAPDVFLGCGKIADKIVPNETWKTAFYDSYKHYEWESRKRQNLCVYCGGTFKGVLSKTCKECGKPKNY